jgi:hypothetical protein
MRTSLLAVSLALLAACAGAPAAPEGPAGSAAQGAQDAERLYRSKCTACHRAYEPSSRTRAAWSQAVTRMGPRAHLTPEQDAALRAWLTAGASDARSEVSAP